MFSYIFIQQRTAIGRYLYAIGGNLEAARVAGIPIHKARIFAFAYSGAMASIAGMIYAGLIASGYADIASGQELLAVASCALAGVSLAGGEGNAFNAVLGALLVSIARTGIVFIGISPYWQDVATALILVIAVIVDLSRRTLIFRS
ncbi:MAG: ABC transporter permease [Ignisphaera sp.]